jgi:MerR family transcriptional regulator, light-induced transcriptional regulator
MVAFPARGHILSRLIISKKAEKSDADEPLYTVRVVAERLGVPTATLRSWNQRYGVGPPEHSPGRHRLYSETDIAVARRMYELIVDGTSPRSAARTAIDSVRPAHGDSAALLVAAFDFDVFTAGLVLDRHLRHFGVLDTWDQLVRPAFDAIALRQSQGEGCIDVEHALSWTVSRSLQRFPIAAPEETPSIILACTTRETHALALEALRAALVEHGRGAVMLGADVPRTALMDAVQRGRRPVAALLWSQTEDTADVRTVNDLAAHASVSVGGPGWDAVIDELDAPRLDSLRAAVDFFVPAGH